MKTELHAWRLAGRLLQPRRFLIAFATAASFAPSLVFAQSARRAGFDWEFAGPALPGASEVSSTTAAPSRPPALPSQQAKPPGTSLREYHARGPVSTPSAPAANGVRPSVPRGGSNPQPQTSHPAERVPAAPPAQVGTPIPVYPPIPAFSPAVKPQPVAAIPPKSPAMMAVLRQSDDHLRRGMELGDRRAYYSSRAEFVQALTILAQALDAEEGSNRRTQALSDGLRALEESDDFVPSYAEQLVDVNVHEIARVHHTPVVRMTEEQVTQLVALQKYYTYAQDRLGEAMAGEPAGSAALSGLGKLHSIMSKERQPPVASAEPKAMALQQAALIAHAENAVAANELGVMLARLGKYEDARGWLQKSISVQPEPATWHNLSVVHHHLGEGQLADQARQAAVAAEQRAAQQAKANLDVKWVSPRVLAASAGADPQVPAGTRPVGTLPPANPQPNASPRTQVRGGPIARLPVVGEVTR